MKWRKIAKRVVFVILVLIALLVILVRTRPVQHALYRAVQVLAQSAGFPFEAQGFQLHPLEISASLSGFKYDKDGVTVRIARLDIDLPWRAFGKDGIHIDSLDADGVEVRILSPEPLVPEPSGQTAELPGIRIRRLDVRNGSFTYQNQSTRLEAPSLSIQAVDGSGLIRVGAPVTINADTRIQIPEIPVHLSAQDLQFGPVLWSAEYDRRMGSGSASGSFRWKPSIGARVNVATNPFSIENWSGIVARGVIDYDQGILNIPEFIVTRGEAQLSGTAKLSDPQKSATLRWSGVQLDPAGIEGATNGRMDLQWKASDFGDVSGTGRLTFKTSQYGEGSADVRISKGRAQLQVDATAMGTAINANIFTGMDRRLSGTFRLLHREYGAIAAEGRLSGTLMSPAATANLTADDVTFKGIGPVDGSANASYRDNTLVLTNLSARLKDSEAPDGELLIDFNTRTIQGAIPVINVELGDFIAEGRGVMQSMAAISGSLDSPIATITASSPSLDIGATHIDSLEADAQLKDNVLQVSRIVARQEQGVLEASGEANLETEQLTGKARVDKLQVTQFRGFSGTVNLEAAVSGTYRAPSAEVSGEVLGVRYQGEEYGTVQIAGSVNQELANLTLQSPMYNASVKASVDLVQPYRFTADLTTNQSAIRYQEFDIVSSGRILAAGSVDPPAVDSLQMENVRLTGEGVSLQANGSTETGIQTDAVADLSQLPLKSVQLGGQAQITAVVKGDLDNPSVDGTLRTMNASVRAADMPEAASVTAAVDFTKDRFTIQEMRGEYADARIVVNGSGSLKGTGEFEFTAENIRPERFLQDRPISGLIGLKGQVTVHAPRPDAIEGRATVTQLDLVAGGVEIRQVREGQVTVANQILTVSNLEFVGPETEALLTGTVAFDSGRLNLDARANTDLRILEGFIERSDASGRIESEVSIRGTLSQPDMGGFINLEDAQIQLSEPSVLISDLTASVQLNGDRFQIQRAEGDLNGGKLTVAGGGGLSSNGLSNTGIRITLMGTQLEYPEGLQSEISANLMLRGSAPNLTLEGNVDVLDSLYRRDIDLNEKLFERLTPQEEGFGASKTPGFTEGINLEVTVNTTGPVVVANNLAKLDLIGDFRVRGTVADPVVLGRASVLDGGEVYFGPIEGGEAAALGERRDRYIVERGTLDFNNALRTEPSIDFEATHELQARDERYLVRLRATGTPTDLRTELTSDPYLSEPDIIAMLLTGRSFADMQSARLTVAREQFLNYLSGQLTSHFFQNAGASLGLDTVTIEPVTIATDEDISARLTVGKNITNDLSLIYSQNLAGPRDQAWIVNYTTFKDFVLRGINRTDQEKLQFELRHGLEFGGGPALPRRVAPRDESRLISVAFDGATGFTNEQLMKQVGKIGDPYNIYRMNDDVRSLRTFFSSQSYPDARVRARRHAFSGMVDVRFTIDQGPRILFEYRGAGVPQKLREDVLRTWEAGSSEAASLKESIGVVLRHFRDDGFLQATVTARNESQNPDDRLYVFMIQPGTKFRKPEWRFQGIEPLDVAESSGEVLENPQRTQERIEFQLRGQGFLDARATVPELVLGNGRPYFSITVDKGVQYMVSALHYTGNSSSFTNTRLTRVVLVGPTEVITPEQAGATRPREADEPLKPFPYTSDWVSRARRRLLTEYWQEGFNDVQIGSSTDYRKGSGRIEISFQIDEGAGQKISEIQIHGDSKTLREHLNRYFQFKTGDPVDYSRINLTRKKLYDTGLFKRVEIEVSPTATGYLANVNLNERAPWSLRYGITLTDHEDNGIRDVGLSNEVTHRNIFGRGILAGLSLKADQSFREARLFTSFPVFRGKDVDTTGALFRTREMLPDSISNTWGFTVQQQRRLSDFYMLTYDYSYRRVNTVERDLTDDDPEIIDGILPVARFNVTLSRDTRDDILNATRGTFFSNSFQVAPPGVGSSVLFVRNYVQYMRFREVLRPNLIWASAYRLGLARSFGDQPMLPDDRFNLGASLRAFGPNSPAFSPGDALFVTNQELRYPLFWRFGVVAFVDLGNVYRRVSTARPLEQRVSPGIGLRIDTPFTLLRLDFGFNPSPKPGESRHRFSWGIGQAF